MSRVKTGLGAQDAHPRDPGCACTVPRPRAQRRVMVRVGPYRGPLLGCIVAVSQACTGRVMGHGRHVAGLLPSPPITIQTLYRNTSSCRACRSSLRRIVACCYAVSQPCCAVSRPKGRPPQPRYKILYRDPPLARPRARAAARSYARPIVSWPFLAVSQGSWALCRSAWAPCRHVPSCAMSRYNFLYHDPAYKNNWAVAQPAFLHLFFFHIISFFFSFVSATARPQKKIYIYICVYIYIYIYIYIYCLQ